MVAEFKKDFSKAIWTVVVAAVISLAATAMQGHVLQQSMVDQLSVMKEEQKVIRQKLDVIQVQLENKVDRSTLDNSLNRIDDKLDKIADNIFKLQQNYNK